MLVNDSRMTFCGTLEYMAPEMVMGKEHAFHVDIWSLGILLFELIHGYAPYKGKNLNDIAKDIMKNRLHFDSCVSEPCRNLIKAIL